MESFGYSGSQVQESTWLWQTMNGNVYFNSSFIELASSATTELMIITGDNKTFFRYDLECSARLQVELIDEVTVTANGTSLTVANMCRCARDKKYGGGIFASPTNATGTTFAETHVIVDDVFKGSAVGTDQNITEWIFGKNEKFVARITNKDATVNTIYIKALFMEDLNV